MRLLFLYAFINETYLDVLAYLLLLLFSFILLSLKQFTSRYCVKKNYLFARARTPVPPHVFFVVHTNGLPVVCLRTVFVQFERITNRGQSLTENKSTLGAVFPKAATRAQCWVWPCTHQLSSWLFPRRSCLVFVRNMKAL